MTRHGRRSRRLPLSPTSSAPIHINIPRWLSRRIRAAAHRENLTEFAFVMTALEAAVAEPPAAEEAPHTAMAAALDRAKVNAG